MIKLLIGLILIGLYLWSPVAIYAGDFDSVSVLLDRHKSSTTTGGLICATPNTTGTEAKIQISWPSGFTVNTSTANWTVNTSDLPSGTTAWPGIGTANAISGQTVTFPSNDLTTGISYCFRFSSANTLTTASSGDNLFGTITTQTSGNSTIDQRLYSLSLVTNDQVGVTASVNASASDFSSQINLLNTDIVDTVGGDVVLNYEVEYTSNLNYPVSVTVQADWSLGTIEGDSVPTVEMLDYVSNSASLGYGGAVPEIDLVNRRISWEITALPATTTESVTFSLLTDGSYYHGSNIEFSVYSRVLGPGVVTPDEEVTTIFYNPPIPGTDSESTSSPTPTATPLSSVSVSPSPTSIAKAGQNARVEQISIDQLTQTSVQLSLQVVNTKRLKLYYGTSLNKLSQSIEAFPTNGQVEIDLSDLISNTSYYFQIELDQGGKMVRQTDVYVFRTASHDQLLSFDPNSLLITSDRLVLLSPNDRLNKPILILTKGSIFEIQLALSKGMPAKRVHIEINRLKVLGLKSDVSSNTNLMEIQPSIYFGQLSALSEPGEYQVSLRTEDYNNSITEQSIFDLIVVPPISVRDAINGTPIPGARVLVSKYNPSLKIYEVFPDSIFPNGNPGKTDLQGQWLVNLPAGKYQLSVSALGYDNQVTTFEIKRSLQDRYPQIRLNRTSFSFGNMIGYYWQSILDFTDQLSATNQQAVPNKGIYQILWSIAIFSLLLGFWFSLYHRTHITWRHILFWLRQRHSNQAIEGRVVDAISGKPLGQVVLNFLNTEGVLIATTTSLKSGKFYLTFRDNIASVNLQRVGYITSQHSIDADNLNNLTFNLSPRQIDSWLTKISVGIANILSSSYEVFLILTIIVEVWLIRQFGIAQIVPLIALTIFNLIIWLIYRRSNRIK